MLISLSGRFGKPVYYLRDSLFLKVALTSFTNHLFICTGISFYISIKTNLVSRTPQAAAWDRILANDKSYEWREVLRSLFPEPDFNECYRFSSLHKAVLRLTSYSIESILKEDTSQLDGKDSYGRTALSWAAYRGDHQAIRTLLSYKPDCSKSDRAGETALVYACRKSLQCMKLLLKADANVHWRHKMTQETLLHVAIRNLENDGGIARVKKLVKAGIDIDTQDIYGETALHLAVHPQEEYIKSATFLINQKADPTIHDSRGNNALSNAVRRNCHALVDLLLQKHQDHNAHLEEYGTFMHLIAEFADMATLRLLAQSRLERRNINIRNRAGLTPLELAEQRNNIDAEWQGTFGALLKTVDKNLYLNMKAIRSAEGDGEAGDASGSDAEFMGALKVET